MILKLQVKLVYGVERIYPMCETANKVVALIGRKTLNRDDLLKLKDIGFKFEWVPVSIGIN